MLCYCFLNLFCENGVNLALWNFGSFCAYKKKSLFENSNRA